MILSDYPGAQGSRRGLNLAAPYAYKASDRSAAPTHTRLRGIPMRKALAGVALSCCRSNRIRQWDKQVQAWSAVVNRYLIRGGACRGLSAAKQLQRLIVPEHEMAVKMRDDVWCGNRSNSVARMCRYATTAERMRRLHPREPPRGYLEPRLPRPPGIVCHSSRMSSGLRFRRQATPHAKAPPPSPR
jgi:hypothetical protein